MKTLFFNYPSYFKIVFVHKKISNDYDFPISKCEHRQQKLRYGRSGILSIIVESKLLKVLASNVQYP